MLRTVDNLSFNLKPIVPFRLDLTAWALRRRANNIVDRWDDEIWSRVIVIDNQPVEISVTQKLRQLDSPIQVRLSGSDLKKRSKKEATTALEKCLGTDKDLSEFYGIASKDKRLRKLANRFLGLKPPRFPSAFEAAVNGIACQQVSLNLGIILLNRLSVAYGLTIQSGKSLVYAFPRPEELCNLQPESFRKLGFSHQKGRAIIELSRAIVSGQLDLEKLETFSNEKALETLCEFRGFGRWTAHYVLLRGLGRVDVFPADDVGGRRGLQRWLGTKQPLDYEKARKVVERWKPYGGLVYFHLLLNRLVQEGTISEQSLQVLRGANEDFSKVNAY